MAVIILNDIFKCIFQKEIHWDLTKISMKFIPKGSTDSNSVLVQAMAWHLIGNKSFPKPMKV